MYMYVYMFLYYVHICTCIIHAYTYLYDSLSKNALSTSVLLALMVFGEVFGMVNGTMYCSRGPPVINVLMPYS